MALEACNNDTSMQQVFTCSVTLNPAYARVSTVYRSISVFSSIRSPVGTTDCQNRLGVRLGQKSQAISIFTNTDAYPEYASFLQQRTWCFVMRSDEVPIEIKRLRN